MVVCQAGHVLKNPTIETLASTLGLSADLDRDGGARRGDRRRRTGRAGRRRLRRVRGAGRAGAREHGARRAGGHQLADRELPRLSDRHLRPGAGRARADPGREVRRRGGHRPHRRAHRLRQPALSRSICPTAGSCARARSSSPPASSYRKLDLPRCSASRGRASTTAPPTSRGSCARARRSPSWAAATRPGRRRCSWPERRHARAHPGAGPGPGREHVALPDPAHREQPEHRAAHAHPDRGAGGRRPARAGALAPPRQRRARDPRPFEACS